MRETIEKQTGGPLKEDVARRLYHRVADGARPTPSENAASLPNRSAHSLAAWPPPKATKPHTSLPWRTTAFPHPPRRPSWPPPPTSFPLLQNRRWTVYPHDLGTENKTDRPALSHHFRHHTQHLPGFTQHLSDDLSPWRPPAKSAKICLPKCWPLSPASPSGNAVRHRTDEHAQPDRNSRSATPATIFTVLTRDTMDQPYSTWPSSRFYPHNPAARALSSSWCSLLSCSRATTTTVWNTSLPTRKKAQARWTTRIAETHQGHRAVQAIQQAGAGGKPSSTTINRTIVRLSKKITQATAGITPHQRTNRLDRPRRRHLHRPVAKPKNSDTTISELYKQSSLTAMRNVRPIKSLANISIPMQTMSSPTAYVHFSTPPEQDSARRTAARRSGASVSATSMSNRSTGIVPLTA